VAANQDVDDPEAYCAWLESQVEEADDLLSSEPMRLQIVPVSDVFVDENEDGLDDETGEPVAEEVPAEEEMPVEEPQAAKEDFHSLLVVEGVWTGDGRYIEEDALAWRNLPLPLMGLDKTTDAHMEARLIGNITRIEREGREIHGFGSFIPTEDAQVLQLQQLIRDGNLRGISVDLDAMEYEVLIPSDKGPVVEEEEVTDEEPGDIAMPMEDLRMRVTAARIMGATVVPFPAFEEAFIESLAAITASLLSAPKVSGFISTLAKYDHIDFSPPQGARDEAAKGLEWRDEYNRGGTAVGVARARDLANGKNISPDTIVRMTSYFARHEVDKQGEGWSPGEDGFPSAGRIAWALWGGDPGRAWSEKVRRQMEAADSKNGGHPKDPKDPDKEEEDTMLASGFPGLAPKTPPKGWFADPGLKGPTPMTVTQEGRIYGHVATWGTCHIGFTDQCVTPPKSAANYQYYLTGEVVCEDGTRVPVGNITMDTGHAPLNANGTAALAHYDNTGLAVADVRTGEDQHGIWMAGAIRPDLDPNKVRALMASDVSGDWRRIGGNLELVGVLAVNVPGFPKPRLQIHENAGLVASLIASIPAQSKEPDLTSVADRIAASIGRSKADRKASIRRRVHKED